MLWVNPNCILKNCFFHKFFLSHSLELWFAFLSSYIFIFLFFYFFIFFFLSWAFYINGFCLSLRNCLSSNTSDLETKIYLHYILYSFMWVSYKHIKEECSQKICSLLATCASRKRELKYGLEYKWWH